MVHNGPHNVNNYAHKRVPSTYQTEGLGLFISVTKGSVLEVSCWSSYFSSSPDEAKQNWLWRSFLYSNSCRWEASKHDTQGL